MPTLDLVLSYKINNMRLTLRQVFTLILFAGLFLMTLRPVADPDFWWHLRTGQLISETRAIPHADPFSFTNHNKTWTAHEWLSELFIYLLYRFGGFSLLILVFSLIITVSFFLVYLRSQGKPYIAGFAMLLGALASAPTWGVRPQMISLLLSSLFLFLLDRYHETRRKRFILPLPFITLVWVNLHAGYVLGLIIFAVYILGDGIEYLKTALPGSQSPQSITSGNIRWLVGVFAASIPAVLVNPNGAQMFIYPLETLVSPSMQQFIQEWLSPDFHQPEWQPLIWLILALIGAGLIGKKRVSVTKLLLVLMFGYAALRSMRLIPLFSIVAVPALAEQTSAVINIRSEVRTSKPLIRSLLIGLLVCVLILTGLRFIQVTREQPGSESTAFPEAAANWISNNKPAGNLYNTYSWGGYLIWRLYPHYLVYIDGRADVYGDEFILDYLHIYNADPDWSRKMEKQGVGVVLIEPEAPLAKVLILSPNWTVAYEDTHSIIFTKH